MVTILCVSQAIETVEAMVYEMTVTVPAKPYLLNQAGDFSLATKASNAKQFSRILII